MMLNEASFEDQVLDVKIDTKNKEKPSEYRWLNDISQQFLEKDYLLPGQTVDQRVNIICDKAESILQIPGFAKKFKENIQKGWYSLSSPIWSNFGTNRGLPISCFGSHIDDSMEGILSAQAEVGIMTKFGGGTSGSFSALRHKGMDIKNNGQTSGAVHFMRLFDNLINIVSQGNVRRGSFAAYLSLDHKDIMEFLSIRSEGSSIQDLSFGVTVPEGFMQSMIDGDIEKRKIWARVLESRANTGFPYIMFLDNVNNNSVDVYKDKNMKITHSNLCVAGDQLVVTDKGMKKVLDLYNSGENLTLFDGEKPVNASPMKLIEKNANIYKITTKSGKSHRVTDYHKIKTKNGMIACKDLKVGDKIITQSNKGLFGKLNDPKTAFLLGLYQADGTQTEDYIYIDIWENDFDLIKEIETAVSSTYNRYNLNSAAVNLPNGFLSSNRILKTPVFNDAVVSFSKVKKKRLGSTRLKQFGFEKGYVPKWVWESDEETQAQYLRGLYIADGTVSNAYHPDKGGEAINISLASVDKPFLAEVQIMLSNFGIKSKIYAMHPARETLLPDGKGSKKLYKCKAVYRLYISNKNDALKFNSLTGFLDRKNVKVENRVHRDNSKKFDEIISIDFDGVEDVYCTTVYSDDHVWVCNGFITSNCSEIMLPDTSDESFVCDLSSMNILYYDEWKDTNAVELLTFFLDAVMTEFIEKAKKIKFMERAVKFAENHRAIGVGWLGFHSYLQSRMIPFESIKAKLANVTIAKTLKEQTYKASQKLALLYGEPPILKGYGRRNTTLLAIAPTKSSSWILNQVSEGIEAFESNCYVKDLAKAKTTFKNPFLEKLLEEKGKNETSIWTSILSNRGSVQHLDFLSKEEKNVFKTSSEISQMEVIILAAQRQKYIDQSQSLNLMIHPKTPIKDVNKLLIEAWKLGIKSLYYNKSLNAAQTFSRELLECASCSA